MTFKFVVAAALGALGILASSVAADAPLAIVVISVPRESTIMSERFLGVDLAKGTFADKPEMIGANLLHLSHALGYQLNDGNRSRHVTLVVKMIPPGDYVWVESGLFVPAGMKGSRCPGEPAPVYSIEPGRINLIRADQYTLTRGGNTGAYWARNAELSDADILEDLDLSRERHPEVFGPVQILQPTAFLTRPPRETKGLFKRLCPDPTSFERVR